MKMIVLHWLRLEFIAKNQKHVTRWYDPKLQAHIATTRSDHFFPISDLIKK